MKALIALLLFAGAAQAQESIWDYSATVTGTESYLPPGYAGDGTMHTKDYSGLITAMIDVVGTGSSAIIKSFSISAAGLTLTSAPGGFSVGDATYQGFGAYINASSNNGVFTGGFTMSSDGPGYYHGPTFSINPMGVSFQFADTNGTCFNHLGTSDGTLWSNAGGGIDMCTVTATAKTAGTWVDPVVNPAPEIDPSNAMSAATLLFGLVAVMRKRK